MLVIGAGILSARLWCYRRQIRHVLEELQMMEQTDTNFLLSSAVDVGRTGELILTMNRILEKKQRLEERLCRENRSYRESITSISHDIRTPLTSAKGYVQMLSAENVTEEKRKVYVETVKRRLDDLAEMLDQLFLYARIEAGEFELKMEKINVGNLFMETLSMFYADFVKKDCEPNVTVALNPCHIYADRRVFIRIIENLLKNALEHGTGDYAFSLVQEGEKAVIRVANRTESIEAADMERIFDRFYTTDTSRSRRTTGLGLAIVKEFVVQMGGTVTASLEEGIFVIEVRFVWMSP